MLLFKIHMCVKACGLEIMIANYCCLGRKYFKGHQAEMEYKVFLFYEYLYIN